MKTLEQIINQYLPKIKEIRYGEFDKKHLKSGEFIDFSTREGLLYFYEKIDEQIPNFSNKKEISTSIFVSYLKGRIKQKRRVSDKGDINMSLFQNSRIILLRQEWQIKQIIPNLKSIIRNTVRGED